MAANPQAPLTTASLLALDHNQGHPHNPDTPLKHHDHAISEKTDHEKYPSTPVDATTLSRDSVISHPVSPKDSSPPSPISIASSAGGRHRQYPTVEAASQWKPSFPPRAYLDHEKFNGPPQSFMPPSYVPTSNPEIMAVLDDQTRPCDRLPEKKSLKILIYLSGPCALLSFLITLWTITSLAIVAVLQPFRFCRSRPSFRNQLVAFLVPPLNLQLRLIYSSAYSTTYSASLMLLIHILSPVVALGVAAASWIAACFWFFSAILGDPAGQDGYNDGRATVLGVRNWWETWLSRALR
ncbi:hypothetical protein K432DRAFT_328874 [Lepidopterella palustris CBS 459.81]|uniref:Uncharacterized protein n=1 Tax=Lepidopterella palustris CBS 459.81 TaxID=1314670 RepID=A0A8E2E9W6_9PEZI|nr:hypothetical protein K432DRAFT_328874 [Lepidopterella palustris CBS 459.81]